MLAAVTGAANSGVSGAAGTSGSASGVSSAATRNSATATGVGKGLLDVTAAGSASGDVAFQANSGTKIFLLFVSF